MTTDYFTSKWIMTVFANSLPFETIPYIFDNLLQDGWNSVYRIGIAILRSIEPKLLKMDMFEITAYLRESVRKDPINIHQLLVDAEKMMITPEDIENYTERFMIEQAEYKIKNNKDAKNQENKDALIWAQEMLNNTEEHAKPDILKFKVKIEDINKKILVQERLIKACKMEYEDIKEQFQQHKDSKKVLEVVYESLKLELDTKRKSK